MNLFDIIGPVMVGPSSSHTAGAAKIGKVSRCLLGEPVAKAEIFFHGSFLATGKGHGTDKALVAGLLGMNVDDIRIPDSFKLAEDAGLNFTIEGIDLGDAHPNSVKMLLKGWTGKKLEITAASIGGGRIEITNINGVEVSFSGELPTLIIQNEDKPGQVNEVTAGLSEGKVNIASMQLHRSNRGGEAVMVMECDQEVPSSLLEWLSNLPGILKVTYLSANTDL